MKNVIDSHSQAVHIIKRERGGNKVTSEPLSALEYLTRPAGRHLKGRANECPPEVACLSDSTCVTNGTGFQCSQHSSRSTTMCWITDRRTAYESRVVVVSLVWQSLFHNVLHTQVVTERLLAT